MISDAAAAASFARTRLPPETKAPQWASGALRFADTFTAELPGDATAPCPYDLPTDAQGTVDVPLARFRASRAVRNALWSWAVPTEHENPRLVSVSPSGAALLNLSTDVFTADKKAAADVWSGCRRLPGSRPWAHCYGGHQFGQWAEQLGDGRAISLGEVESGSTRWDVQLKGAGRTAYSRFGDGYAVRRSSVREYLAAEHVHALGVPSSRSLALVFTDRVVLREEAEFGAVVTRLAPSWVRFGSFELPAARRDYALVRTLADYVIRHHYPAFESQPDRYVHLLREVVERTALTVARWQAVGFCHGVMNTDNMSVLGLTIDYGPFAFLDAFDPDFICNHSDTAGRYAFREQPRVALWNLMRLAAPLATIIDGRDQAGSEGSETEKHETKPETVEAITAALNAFGDVFRNEYVRLMRRKFGLMSTAQPSDLAEVVQPFLDLLERAKTDYTFAIRSLCDVPPILSDDSRLEAHVDSLASRSLGLSCSPDAEGWRSDMLSYYRNTYRPRLMVEANESTDDVVVFLENLSCLMKKENPKYVLRNWVAQDIIERVDKGEEDLVDRALELLTTCVFEDRLPDHLKDLEFYAGPVPEWGEGLHANNQVTGRKCTSDAQCVKYRHGDSAKTDDADRINGDSGASVRHKARLGEYACIASSCHYIVKAGELCFSARDCAAYQLDRRWALAPSSANGTTDAGIRGEDDIEGSSQSWCAPQFCTLESTCGGAWTLPGAPIDTPPGVDSKRPITNGTVSCCRGFMSNAQCGIYSGAVDTCDSGFTCASSRNINSNSAARQRKDLAHSQNMIVDLRQAALDTGATSLEDGMPVGKCVSQEPHQQVWIGVLLVLIGGATLNIGLNLQKYAFRKREERIKADEDAAAAAAAATTAAIPAVAEKQKGVDADRGALVSVDREKMEALTRSPSSPDEIYFYSNEALNKQRHLDAMPKSKPGIGATSDVFPRSAQSHPKNDGITEISGGHRRFSSSSSVSSSSLDNVKLSFASNRKSAADPTVHPTKGVAWKLRIHERISRHKHSKTPFGSPAWAVGLVIFILGNVVNFVALQFAPQSLVAPLGAVSLVTNVIVAPLLNKEKISLFDVGGIALIIAGCVIVVVFSGIVQQNYRLCVLIQLLKAKPTVIYLCLIFGAILAIYIFLWTVERGVERYRMENHELVDDIDHSYAILGSAAISQNRWGDETVWATAAPRNTEKTQLDPVSDARRRSSDMRHQDLFTNLEPDCKDNTTDPNGTAMLDGPLPISESTTDIAIPHGLGYQKSSNDNSRRLRSVYARVSSVLFRHPLMCFDPYIRPIRPASRLVKYGLPLAYASLGSFMATLTTLFAKSLVNLLAASLFDHENQFNNFISWVILLVTAFTAASQVYWINQGLLRYDALLQVPVFYVVWTVFDIIGGGVYFNEFKMFTTVKYVLFTLGVAVIFSGVGLLSHRMRGA
ncbi:hypothetical protein LPJ53_005027 [Coemansia erecta]|uniref:Selenoprotein O n=1 Tax=Coemansia erecta TaxID=147472 RepID=A0A9W7XX84_9FUNG|nr:hypothetical protein LPJ53_005027 [Coemansia erecta]